jgi:capsid assembly protease
MKILDIFNMCWAIDPSRFTEMANVYLQHLKGEKIDFKAFLQDEEGTRQDEYQVINNKAIIPVKGVLTPGASFFSFFFGGTSMESIKRNIQKAIANKNDIILHINTPGGTVEGGFELADFIEEAAKTTSIIGFSDGMIASMGMLISGACEKTYITGKTNQVGSIGVIARRMDFSKANEMEGINVEEFVSGKFKNINSPDKEINDFDRGEIQGQVDYLFSLFSNDMSRRLGLQVDKIVDMQAKIFIGEQAIEQGLVSGVASLDDLINDIFQHSTNKGIMTLEELKAESPDLYNKIVNDSKAEATKAGAEEGAKAEQARVLSIQSAAFPGMEELTAKLIADGTAPGEAALMFNQLEKQKGIGALAQIIADAPAPVVSVEPEAVATSAKPKTVKEEFEGNAGLKEEFGDLATYEAYLNAEKNGQVSIFGK